MPIPPASTKTSLSQRLTAPAGLDQDQPQPATHRPRPPTLARLAHVHVRFRGQFAYIDGQLPDGAVLPLCRLRYGGSASRWGFAIYRASHDDYQDNYLPTGDTAGAPEDALDCACGLYLGTV